MAEWGALVGLAEHLQRGNGLSGPVLGVGSKVVSPCLGLSSTWNYRADTLAGSHPPTPAGVGLTLPSHLSSISCIMFSTETHKALDVGHQPHGVHSQQEDGELPQGQQVQNLPLLQLTCPCPKAPVTNTKYFIPFSLQPCRLEDHDYH